MRFIPRKKSYNQKLTMPATVSNKAKEVKSPAKKLSTKQTQKNKRKKTTTAKLVTMTKNIEDVKPRWMP